MRRFTRREVLGGLGGAAAAAWLAPGCGPQDDGTPPNLLVLLADDQRWDSLGVAGNRVVQTPNLDALARRGTYFRRAFVTTSICPASRASILCGELAGGHGVFAFAKSLSPARMDRTYPAVLRQHGYETAFMGKWGVNADRVLPDDEGARYFDYWAGAGWHDNYWHESRCPYVTTNGRERPTANVCGCPPVGAEPRRGKEGLYEPLHLITQILPRRFEDFLDTRDPARPFCASVSFKAPHAPLEDFDPRYTELYRDAEIELPPTFSLTPDPLLPPALRDSYSTRSDLTEQGEDGVRNALRDLYRHMSGLDFAVGEMLHALAQRGLDDDTVVLFTSDNGCLFGEHGLWGKSLIYEESIRVPLIVADPRRRWPWRVPESDAMVLNVDLSPTLCELGGAAPPENIDGRSLVPLLRGEVDSLRDAWFFEHRFRTRHIALARSEGIRTARWKYVRLLDEASRELLFDLEADPYEQRDLSLDSAFAATLADLRSRSFELGTPARPEREPGAQNVPFKQRLPAAAPSPGAPSPAAAARRESRRRRARRAEPR